MPITVPNWSLSIARDSALGFFTTNPILLNEQMGVETDTRLFKYGDGVTAWNNLPYMVISPFQGIWMGISAKAGNLITIDPTDKGFVLLPSALDAMAEFNQAFAGTITDITPYTAANQNKAAAVKAGIVLRNLVTAMGSDYAGLFTGVQPTKTLTLSLSDLTTALNTLNSYSHNLIDDGVSTTTKTWSSNHIETVIANAVVGLVGAAPTALNTIFELAAALDNNPNLVTTIVTELGNALKVSTQVWNDTQKTQARANINAADATATATALADRLQLVTQVLTVGQQAQVRANINAADATATTNALADRVTLAVQSLTAPQQAQVRANIGAADVTTVVNKAGDTMTGALNGATPVSVASSGTTNIGAVSANTVTITGTVTITSLGTIAAGAERNVIFAGSLILTHNAVSLILLGGANIATAAGDTARFVSLGGGNWRCLDYTPVSGKALVQPTAVDSLSTVGGWTISESGGMLYFNFGGVVKARLDQTGNLMANGNNGGFAAVD